MSGNKPQNPWVVAGLAIAAIFALGLVWNAYVESTSLNSEQQRAIDELNEATKNLRRVEEEQKNK